MTEAEWDACTDPKAMLDYLPGRPSGRKLRLFGCACCRRVWELLDDRGRRAVSAAEGHAEGLMDDEGLEEARRQADRDRGPVIIKEYAAAGWAFGAAHAVVFDDAYWNERAAAQGALTAAWCAAEAAWRSLPGWSVVKEQAAQACLLRDVVENPYRPGWTDPSWLTATVRQLAEGIHADRAFDRLPRLAAALEGAGCDNAEVLAHCRGKGPHVRGCWVVDLLLGKE